MIDDTVLLDPTSERRPAMRGRTGPPPSLDGLTVGLVDIRKRQGDKVLDRLEALFRERGVRIERFSKPTFAKPAPRDAIDRIAARCDTVVEGLAD